MGRTHFLLFFALLFSLTGCGSVQKLAVGTTAGLLYDASYEMESEPNWEHLKNGIGPNLKMIEGLYSLSPEDDDLLVALVKGYTAYAFAIFETEALADQMAGKSDSAATRQAQHFYSRAIQYGIKYFEEEGFSWDDLVRATREDDGVPGLLARKLPTNKRALEAAVFFGQAVGGLINLKKDDMVLVAQLPVAKGMFDWACKEDPNINHGACDIFYGAYEAGRPKMLGGNPEKGKEIFLKAISNNPHNWLARVAYLQYYVLPMFDEDEWAGQKKALDEAQKIYRDELVWRPDRAKHPALEDESYRAFQAIALKRWEIIRKHEKDLF